MSIIAHLSAQILQAQVFAVADGPADVILLLAPEGATHSDCKDALATLQTRNDLTSYAVIPPAVEGHPCSFLALRPRDQARAAAGGDQGGHEGALPAA